MKNKSSSKDLLEARKTLANIALVRIATSSKTGRPHSSTLLFVPDDDFGFYFITKEDTAKTKNLADNPWVSASLGDGPPMAFQMFGRARRIKAEPERQTVMEKWAKKAAELKDLWPPIFRLQQSEYAIYHFKPTRVTAIDLRKQNLSGGNTLFMRLV